MKKKIFATLLVAIFVSHSVSAQNEKAQIDSLQQRIAKLEKRAVTWDKVKQHFKISGYIQAAYFADFTDGETDASYFRIRRARLSLAGKIVDNEKVGMADYRLQVDFAESPKIVLKNLQKNKYGISIHTQ